MGEQKIDFTTHNLEDISKLQEQMSETNKKVDDLSEIKSVLVKLSTIQQQMVDDNKIRDKERKENAKAMIDLSNAVKQTSDNVDKLSKKLDANDKKLDGFISNRDSQREKSKSRYVFLAAIIGSMLTSITAIIVAIL